MALTAPQHKYRCLFQILSSFFCCNQHSTSAIAHDTAIEQVQRISNHTGVEYILRSNRLAVHCKRVETGMPACYDGNLSELFMGGTILVHVPASRPRISAYKCIAVGKLLPSFTNTSKPSTTAQPTPHHR